MYVVLTCAEDLNYIPRTHVKRSGVMAYSCKPSIGEVGQEGSWGLMASQPSFPGEPQGSERTGL